MTVRLSRYAAAGVREYRLVDPDRKKIVVYDLENEEILQVYGREERVPVAVFGGNCSVDFGEIFGYVDFPDESEQMVSASAKPHRSGTVWEKFCHRERQKGNICAGST